MRNLPALARTAALAATLVVGTALATVAPAVAAPPNPAVPRQVVETDSSRVRLPADSYGTVVVTTCSDCPSLTLKLTPDTEFLLDRRAVTLTEWKSFAAGGSVYGVDVEFVSSDRTLLSLRLATAAKIDRSHP